MYDISQLKKKLLTELQEISEKLKITNYKKLKKTDLIYEILDKQSIGKKDEGIKELKEISEEKPKEFNIDNSITISELAKRWGVSVNTMENYVYRGRCPNYYKLGHGIKFDLDDVREYENENYFVTKKS